MNPLSENGSDPGNESYAADRAIITKLQFFFLLAWGTDRVKEGRYFGDDQDGNEEKTKDGNCITRHQNDKQEDAYDQAHSKARAVVRNTAGSSSGPGQKFSFNLRVSVNAPDGIRKSLHPKRALACVRNS